MNNSFPWTSNAQRVQESLSLLEGATFGKLLSFTTIYSSLSIDLNGGWTKIEQMRDLPGLDEFAQELDAAIAPIRKEYAKKLRLELALECRRVADISVKGLSP